MKQISFLSRHWIDATVLAILAVAALVLVKPAGAAPHYNKIKWDEVISSQGDDYSIEVVGRGEVGDAGGTRITVETESGTTFDLTGGTLRRRSSTDVAVGEPGIKGVTIKLELKDVAGKVLLATDATIAPGYLDSQFTKGKAANFSVDTVQLHKMAKAGLYSISFIATGEGTAQIATGTLSTETLDKAGKPVTSTTAIDTNFDDERTFSAPVHFDGDPVGFVYAFVTKVSDANGKQVERGRTLLQIVQSPTNACGGPGPIHSEPAEDIADRHERVKASGKPTVY